MMVTTMLPHEWKAAASSLKDLQKEVGKQREQWRQLAFGFLLPVLIGGLLAYWLLPAALQFAANKNDATALLAVAAGVLAFTAILIGFVVTLMLSTGRIDTPEHIEFEELRQLIERTRNLLYSQAITLFSAIILCGLVIIWSLLAAGKFDSTVVLWLGTLTGGFTGLCLLRSVLLPLQIWELHQASFDYAIEAKKVKSNSRFLPK